MAGSATPLLAATESPASDIVAPPMLLLIGMAIVGLALGRRKPR